MAAASLAKLLGKNLHVTLVESDEISTVGVGEATIPTLLTLRIVKIKEQDFVAAVQGTFKLGISFEERRNVGGDYIHSFGYTGKDFVGLLDFSIFENKGKQLGLSEEFGDYCTGDWWQKISALPCCRIAKARLRVSLRHDLCEVLTWNR